MLSMISLVTLATAMQLPATEKPVEVRVGIVAFEDFRGEFERSEKLLAELSAANGTPLRFKLAVGTYGDVAHWLKQGLVDVAVVTPGLFVETVGGAVDGDGAPPAVYLATVGRPPAMSKWARDDRKQPGYYDHYRSVCVVAGDSSLKSAEDLKRAAGAGRLRFLCVHPSSASSRIAPAYALKQMGIGLREDQIEYTHSHSASLRLLAGPKRDKIELVAFVWDDAGRNLPDLADSVRVVPLPEQDQLVIPSDAVVARGGFDQAELIERLLLAHTDAEGRHDFLRPPEGQTHYDAVRRWKTAAVPAVERDESQKISLDEIGRLLVHYSRSQPAPPRIALVLSSGGAKCSYQVGAVAALEEKLEELRRDNPGEKLDIALVVGTSGGAINSVPIALGVTGTPEGRDDFLTVWSRLDQRKIVRPSLIVRANIGLWFAILQAAVVTWIMQRFVKQPQRRAWVFGGLFAALAAVEIVLGYLDRSPWSWLGENHWLHHSWLWMTFGVAASAWCVLAAGLAVVAWQWALVRRGKYLTVSGRWAKWIFATGLILLPIVQVITVLFHQDTLSDGEGIEHTLAQQFPWLIDRHLERHQQKPLATDSGKSDKLRLRSVSRQLMSRRLLARDLVITGTCIAQSSQELPRDLYFFAAAGGNPAAPPFGPRGIPLAQHEGQVLDVMLGSGSIFPVFPSRRLEDFPRPGEYAELVDGAFAHYSPIEAAVLWGATHIILIEASPRERVERENFLQNALAAFGHLYEQSQSLDTRSRGKISIFTLAPEPPHLCLLDFSDNLIRNAAAKGYRDAGGRSPAQTAGGSGGSRFQKELGEPLFQEIAAPSE